MKQKTCLLFAFASMVLSCGNTDQNNLSDNIPGTYVRPIQHEHATGMDSLVVAVLDKEAGTFTVTQRSGFKRILDGKELSPEHKTEQFITVLDHARKQLTDQQKDQVFTIVPEKKVVMMGSTEYQKK